MTGATPLSNLKGVGPQLVKKLSSLQLATVSDLAAYLPRRYEDYSLVTPVAKLKPGKVTIEAKITHVAGRYVRRGMHITEAIATDTTGSTRLVWFNQPYRMAALKQDTPYFISGTYELSHQRFALLNPTAELTGDFPISTARIVPIYRETKGLNSRQLRQLMAQIVPYIVRLPETLPPWILERYKLVSYSQAVHAMHFPENGNALADAKQRLGFEEVFRLILASLLNKQENDEETAVTLPFNETLARRFVQHLPFQLTDGQRKVIWQIYQDLQQPHPMNRLVEGDVGSGKTVVAAMAALMALERGYQVAFMAPTELLARQHADTLFKLLHPLSLSKTLVLLIGSMSAAQKRKAIAAVKAGRAQFLIGTHTLIQENVDFHSLALIVIDEQHRFGVEQRKALMAKAGHMPHVLSLTATPIPRSLALTLYGELNISVLAEKPPGRQHIITKIVSPNAREQLYQDIRKELGAGRQMFVVCPLIAESDTVNANSAEKVYEEMTRGSFKEYRVGLLHGKMKADRKTAIMEAFVQGQLDILVSTTVIEVGVDVPNATVMLIEAPERFGLAQIHQLRGRVGRGDHQGYCYLLMSDSQAPSRRLRALQTSQDGFKLAELDLDIRGPGAIYGTQQHGQLDLRVAKLSDTELISEARQAAELFIAQGDNLLQYKQLATAISRLRAVTNLN